MITSFGPSIQPTRQPVIAYVLATPFSTTVRSASSGTATGIDVDFHVAVRQVLVDLVGDHPQTVRERPLADGLDLLGESTAPVGFDGEQNSSALVLSVRAASSCSTVTL